uniref:Transposase n=1 Tax=uncultured Desulfobacterium sp. TaxID=201089 RepID=E1Y9R7_9BACT|nr:hypothetical protein N47_H21330 [uncultured Desulfobacterium sp.]
MIKETVYPGIDEYMMSFFNYFHREEGRNLARNYVIGLIMDGERKSVRQAVTELKQNNNHFK